MQPKLEGYSAAVLTALTDSDRLTVAQELEQVNALVETRSDLRAALTDTAIASPVRAAVVRDLLTTKVSDVVVRLASYAAAASPAQDVPKTFAELAHYALVRSRPETHVPAGLSLLDARRRVGGYADAILEDLPVSAFGAIEDDLFRWARTIESNTDLRRVLVNRDATVESRLEITRRLLEGKVAAPSLSLALYVIEGGRPRDVVGTLDYLVDYTAQARNWRVARVHSARDLDESSQTQLVNALRTITGHEVQLQVVLDPSLLGGVLVEVGDLRLDATTKGRLGALREEFDINAVHDLQLHHNS